MITIAICDDEKYILDKLKRLTVGFFQRKKVEVKVIVFRSGEELLDYQQNIDILFLDIQMDGIDGMETARRLRNRNFRGYLIFITVLREMVFESFAVQPYDYLLKPMKEEAFVKTMERLFASMQEERAASLLVQRGYESSLVPFSDIIFCEIIDRKIYLHLKTGEVIDYYDRLERLETKLDSRFYKCHRSYLINLNYLKSYKNGMAYMINGKAIPVSRLRGEGVLRRYFELYEGMDFLHAIIKNPLILPLVLLISRISGPLNEEFGWRGYALDKLLVRFGFLGASTILGFVWGIWHLAWYFTPGQAQYQLLQDSVFHAIMYIPSVMMLSSWVTFVYIKTKRSILAGALVHMFSNLTGSQLLSSYTTEVGVLIRYANMVFFAIIILYVIFSRKFEKEVEEQIAMIKEGEENK